MGRRALFIENTAGVAGLAPFIVLRKLLPAWGFSVQRPRRVLARADAAAQNRWHRHTYPALKKSASTALGAGLH